MTESIIILITAVITGILGPILVITVKFFLDKYKAKLDMVTEALQTSERVSYKLDQIKHEFNADRVWVAQFHNGGHFYPTGKSITKFSMVYEIVGPEVTSIQSSFQNIPVSLFSRPINHLLENNIVEIPDYKDETVATFGLKYVAVEAGTKSSYMFAIKTIDNKFIGVLCVDFTKKKVKINHESLDELSNYATAIGGVLNTHLQAP